VLEIPISAEVPPLISDLLIGAMSCPLNPNDPELTKVNDPELMRS
jgi:hypothetical protein